MGMSGKVFLIATIRHGQTCTRLVVSPLVHVCPLSLLLMMCGVGLVLEETRALMGATRLASGKQASIISSSGLISKTM